MNKDTHLFVKKSLALKVAQSSEEGENLMRTLFPRVFKGKKYIITDNSWIKNVKTGEETGISLVGKQAWIAGKPYMETVKMVGHPDRQKKFINVVYDMVKYRVLYEKRNVL